MEERQELKIDPSKVELDNSDKVVIKDEGFNSILRKSPTPTIESIKTIIPSIKRDDFNIDFDGSIIIKNQSLLDYIKENPINPIFGTSDGGAANNCNCQIQNGPC